MAVLITNIGVFMRSESPLMSAHEIIPRLLSSSLIVILLLQIMGALVIFVYSRKIAGPFHQLKTALDKMLKGDLSTPIAFRRDDEFRSIGEAVDALRDKLNRAVADGAIQAARIEKELGDLIRHISDKKNIDRKEVLADLTGLQDRIQYLKNWLKSNPA
jgi:methyl-accepting chemotaxis protein